MLVTILRKLVQNFISLAGFDVLFSILNNVVNMFAVRIISIVCWETRRMLF